VFFWSPISNDTQRVKSLQIRFPYYAPLFDIIATYFIYNIPAEFWLQKTPSPHNKLTANSDISKQLTAVLNQQLVIEIEKQLDYILQLPNKVKIEKESEQKEEQVHIYNTIHTLFWLLEEWALGCRLLQE
jgi:hypothetical protein